MIIDAHSLGTKDATNGVIRKAKAGFLAWALAAKSLARLVAQRVCGIYAGKAISCRLTSNFMHFSAGKPENPL
jgi:hypothetical protein